jgi:predicted metal-dependent hydrolase
MIENGQPDGGFLLLHGDKQIPFTVEFRKRAKLAITVHPDMRVQIAAPTGSDMDAVLARVENRAGWISKQLRYFEQYQPTQPAPRYVSGETHLFLGRQYRLKVRQAESPGVKLIGRFFFVYTENRNDPQEVQNLLEAWYRDHAERLFTVRLRATLDSTKALAIKACPTLLIRRMERRWGSCTKAGNILLNVDLIKAPIHCINYVIMHELCHLKVHNHGDEFYRLLTRCMPDWESRKRRLEAVVP